MIYYKIWTFNDSFFIPWFLCWTTRSRRNNILYCMTCHYTLAVRPPFQIFKSCSLVYTYSKVSLYKTSLVIQNLRLDYTFVFWVNKNSPRCMCINLSIIHWYDIKYLLKSETYTQLHELHYPDIYFWRYWIAIK